MQAVHGGASRPPDPGRTGCDKSVQNILETIAQAHLRYGALADYVIRSRIQSSVLLGASRRQTAKTFALIVPICMAGLSGLLRIHHSYDFPRETKALNFSRAVRGLASRVMLWQPLEWSPREPGLARACDPIGSCGSVFLCECVCVCVYTTDLNSNFYAINSLLSPALCRWSYGTTLCASDCGDLEGVGGGGGGGVRREFMVETLPTGEQSQRFAQELLALISPLRWKR